MRQSNETAQAIGIMVVAMLILPGIDAIAKWLSGSVSSGQVTFSRFLFQVLFMFPLLFDTQGKWLTAKLWLHGARGFFIAIATLLFFSSLAHLPIADAISIFFIEPLLVTLLSAVLLGETVGWRRILAISIGFIGSIIIIRPTFIDVGWPALYPVGAAACFSFYILLTRKLVASEDPVRLQFNAGVFGLLTMSAALAVGTHHEIDVLRAVWPTTGQWVLLAALGFIATLGHLLVVLAFRHAPVSVLAPFQYVEIIGATILGFVFFNDFPDPLTWVGILIIVGSGVYMFHREAIVQVPAKNGNRPSRKRMSPGRTRK